MRQFNPSFIGRVILTGKDKAINSNLESITIEGKQEDLICSFIVKQVFINQTDETVECKFVYPTNAKMCTYGLKFIINNKEIIPTLKEKEEAKAEFNEAIQKGHTALIGEDLGSGLGSFKIGNLPAKKTCIIEQKYCMMATQTNKGYMLKIPLKTSYQSGQCTDNIPKEFKFTYELRSQVPLKSAKATGCKSTPIERGFRLTANKLDDYNSIQIEAEMKKKHEIVAIKAGQYAFIQACPFFDTKVLSNNEFVFIVDCSGSMSGSRIEAAKKCLQIFVKSLPLGCRFSIVCFGSSMITLTEMADYNDKSLAQAMNNLRTLKANLGLTYLLQPLQSVFATPPKEGFARQVFILTDGETEESDRCIAECSKNAALNRVFAVGVADADPGLIESVAEITRGSAAFVTLENLEERVTDLLADALAPAAISTQVFIDSTGTIETFPHPLPALYSGCSTAVIVKGAAGKNVLITADAAGKPIELAAEAIEKDELEEAIAALFAFSAINELQHRVLLGEANLKKRIVELSIASGILSQQTAYVGTDLEVTVLQHRRTVLAKLFGKKKNTSAQNSTPTCMKASIVQDTWDKYEGSCSSMKSGFSYSMEDDDCLEDAMDELDEIINSCNDISDALCAKLGSDGSDMDELTEIMKYYDDVSDKQCSQAAAKPERPEKKNAVGSPMKESESDGGDMDELTEIMKYYDDVYDKQCSQAAAKPEQSEKKKVVSKKQADTVESILEGQAADGGWSEKRATNKKLIRKYGARAAATVEAIATLRKIAGRRLAALKLVIAKAFQFLKTVDAKVNWEAEVANLMK